MVHVHVLTLSAPHDVWQQRQAEDLQRDVHLDRRLIAVTVSAGIQGGWGMEILISDGRR